MIPYLVLFTKLTLKGELYSNVTIKVILYNYYYTAFLRDSITELKHSEIQAPVGNCHLATLILLQYCLMVTNFLSYDQIQGSL